MPISPNDPDYKRIMQAHQSKSSKEREETMQRELRLKTPRKKTKKF